MQVFCVHASAGLSRRTRRHWLSAASASAQLAPRPSSSAAHELPNLTASPCSGEWGEHQTCRRAAGFSAQAPENQTTGG